MPVSLNAALTVPPLARAPFTTSQPFTYRDSYTLERYVEEIRCHLDSLNQVVIELSAQASDADAELSKRIDGLVDDVEKLSDSLDELVDMVGSVIPTNDVWNVTKGRYTSSPEAMRDTYRELAVFGARVNQIANLTVNKLAEHTVNEVSAVGNYTIFNDSKPRVTDPQTGEPYGGQ